MILQYRTSAIRRYIAATLLLKLVTRPINLRIKIAKRHAITRGKRLEKKRLSLDRLEEPTEKRGNRIVSPGDRNVSRAQRGKFFISTSEVVSRERCRLKHRSHLPRSCPTLYRYGQMGYPGDKNSYLSSNSCRQFLFLFTFRSLRVSIDQLLVDRGFLYSDEYKRRNRIIINRRLFKFVNITTSKRSICV